MLVTVGLFLFSFAAFYWLFIANLKIPPALNGLYSVEGPLYSIKTLAFQVILVLQKLAKARQKDCKVFKKSWEQPRKFSEESDNLENDSVFFIGSDLKNGLTFIVSTERRPNNITYGLVYIMVIFKEKCFQSCFQYFIYVLYGRHLNVTSCVVAGFRCQN